MGRTATRLPCSATEKHATPAAAPIPPRHVPAREYHFGANPLDAPRRPANSSVRGVWHAVAETRRLALSEQPEKDTVKSPARVHVRGRSIAPAANPHIRRSGQRQNDSVERNIDWVGDSVRHLTAMVLDTLAGIVRLQSDDSIRVFWGDRKQGEANHRNETAPATTGCRVEREPEPRLMQAKLESLLTTLGNSR